MMGWIGVDLDGTLAEYGGWQAGAIGSPIPRMIDRVKEWLQEGKDVRIFTARANPEGRSHRETAWEMDRIKEWCREHIGQELLVTCCKDKDMDLLYDDRCVTVEKNTGRLITDVLAEML